MKKLFIISIMSLTYLVGFAQGVAINESGVSADPSAILDISSSAKGLLIPHLRTNERIAIANPANGLMVFDIDTWTFWYFRLGVWKEILDTNDAFALPYDGIGADPGKLFSITNNSAAINTAIYGRRLNGAGMILSLSNGIWGDNADGNGVAGTSSTSNGVAGFSNLGTGVYANSNIGTGMSASSASGFGITSSSSGVDKAGVLGVNTNNSGIGYGVIGSIENPTGGAAVYGKNLCPAGNAGLFTNTNTTNIDPALKATTTGNGAAGYFSALGLGPSGYFVHSNPNNPNPGLLVSNFASGTGLAVWQVASNTNSAVQIMHNGSGKGLECTGVLGQAGEFIISNANNANIVLKSSTIGTGKAALFDINNTTNTDIAMTASTNGKGKAGYFNKNNTSGSISDIIDPAVLIDNTSKGNALKITSLHSPSVNAGIDVNYDGQSFGMNVNSTHGGIHVASQNSNNVALLAEHYQNGTAIKANNNHQTNPAIIGDNQNAIGGIGILGKAIGANGIGIKGTSSCNNYEQGSITGINTSAVFGIGIYGQNMGTQGFGIYGVSNSEYNSAIGAKNNNGGTAIDGESGGGQAAVGVRGTADASAGNWGSGVVGQNYAEGDGVRGFAGVNGSGISGFDHNNGYGMAGYFNIFHSSNAASAVKIENEGAGPTLNMIASSASNNVTMVRFTKSGTGDYAVFEEGNGVNEIRFDNNGKGFFNGGTQTGGADIAESFAVIDDIKTYEPGDVLIISTDEDRTVVKSNEPYSNLVAGVFATKPGVLMSEEHIDTDLSDQVPMGVVGVIPTKVCNEGGEILRGDMLVTSSIPGVAMKADPDKVKIGQVIGKALENYSSNEISKIKVLVSIR